MNLSDKLVMLCVCGGFCNDARNTFVHGNHRALFLVAPDQPISSDEAVEFFPDFLVQLRYDVGTSGFEEDLVDDILATHNEKAHGKMKCYSGDA